MNMRIALIFLTLAIVACDSGSSSRGNQSAGSGTSSQEEEGGGDGGTGTEESVARFNSLETHGYETNFDSAKWVEEGKSGDLGSTTYK